MGRAHELWKKVEVTAYGDEIGEFLASFFDDERYKDYKENTWRNTYCEAEPFDIYAFKEAAVKFNVTVEFRVL